MSRIDGYKGSVLPVNPRYKEIEGLPCFRSLDELPEIAEHVVLSLGAEQIEAKVAHAIRHGAKAVTIFNSCQLEGDEEPRLLARLGRMADEAGVVICGPNTMGFYNRTIGLRVAGFPSPPGLRAGGIVFIAQSGSAFAALAHNDRRVGFSLVVSSGAELTATAADYLEWAIGRPETRVIGLFLEQVREPERFVTVLAEAESRGLPVVALKVGRTARSAAMALSHTGAMAGSDTGFVSMCRRYNVIIVDDLDELSAMLLCLDQRHAFGPGALASMHDSGGEREMVVDLAERLGVEFANISAATVARIAPQLDPGLLAENPLDAWGTARDFVDRFSRSFGALVEDPAVAAGVFFSDVRENYWYSAGVVEAVRRVAAKATKPVLIATNYSKTLNHSLAAALAAEGIPVMEGTRESLLALKRAFRWRDRRAMERESIAAAPVEVVARWRARLASGVAMDEREGLELLADFGLPVVNARVVRSLEGAVAAADAIGLPVALKTAAGHTHKSDVKGVHLGLASAAAVRQAYADLAERLGSQVLVASMAPAGVEIGLGAIIDKDYGPIVVLSAGGTLIEILDDKVAALAPIGPMEATELLGELRIAKVLAGGRGRQPTSIASLADAISRFSVLVAGLADVISEIDVNPIIAGPGGAVAVDALVIADKGSCR
jgi:acyl-CoA synthetase (NDP forming)